MGKNVSVKFLGVTVYEKREVVEQRNSPVTPIDTPEQWFMNMLGATSNSGIVVTDDLAMTLSTVWSCVRVLGETLAMLPLNVYTRDASGNRNIAYGDYLQTLLHDKPNGLMTSFVFRQTMQMHLALGGNAYAIIHRDRFGKVQELELVEYPKLMMVVKSTLDGQKYFHYQGKTYANYEIFHVMGMSFYGLKGISPIAYARENFGTGIALQQFGGSFFKNGARMSGVIEAPGKLSEPAYKNLKESFNKEYAGTDNVGKTAILEGGAKYVANSLSNEDAQYLASRKFSTEEIARIFRVPLHMVGNLDKATNNNIEHQGIEFVTSTMTPYVENWEQEISCKLIEPSLAGKKYAKFNMKALLRGDSAARAALYKELFYTSSITPNEIRDEEEMNHYDGGDKCYVPANMMPADLVETILLSGKKPGEVTK